MEFSPPPPKRVAFNSIAVILDIPYLWHKGFHVVLVFRRFDKMIQ